MPNARKTKFREQLEAELAKDDIALRVVIEKADNFLDIVIREKNQRLLKELLSRFDCTFRLRDFTIHMYTRKYSPLYFAIFFVGEQYEGPGSEILYYP